MDFYARACVCVCVCIGVQLAFRGAAGLEYQLEAQIYYGRHHQSRRHRIALHICTSASTPAAESPARLLHARDIALEGIQSKLEPRHPKVPEYTLSLPRHHTPVLYLGWSCVCMHAIQLQLRLQTLHLWELCVACNEPAVGRSETFFWDGREESYRSA